MIADRFSFLPVQPSSSAPRLAPMCTLAATAHRVALLAFISCVWYASLLAVQG